MAITEGVVLAPSLFSIIFGSPPSMTAISESVVPRSIPTIFDMVYMYLLFRYFYFCRTHKFSVQGVSLRKNLNYGPRLRSFFFRLPHCLMKFRIEFLSLCLNLLHLMILEKLL